MSKTDCLRCEKSTRAKAGICKRCQDELAELLQAIATQQDWPVAEEMVAKIPIEEVEAINRVSRLQAVLIDIEDRLEEIQANEEPEMEVSTSKQGSGLGTIVPKLEPGKSKPGRPPGSKSAPNNPVVPPTCPHCGSSRRSKYTGVRTLEISGALRDGRTFSAVTKRRCFCLNCNRPRIDNEFHLEPTSN